MPAPPVDLNGVVRPCIAKPGDSCIGDIWLSLEASVGCGRCAKETRRSTFALGDAIMVARRDPLGVDMFKNSLLGLKIVSGGDIELSFVGELDEEIVPFWLDSKVFGSIDLRLRWPPRGTRVVSIA